MIERDKMFQEFARRLSCGCTIIWLAEFPLVGLCDEHRKKVMELLDTKEEKDGRSS